MKRFIVGSLVFAGFASMFTPLAGAQESNYGWKPIYAREYMSDIWSIKSAFTVSNTNSDVSDGIVRRKYGGYYRVTVDSRVPFTESMVHKLIRRFNSDQEKGNQGSLTIRHGEQSGSSVQVLRGTEVTYRNAEVSITLGNENWEDWYWFRFTTYLNNREYFVLRTGESHRPFERQVDEDKDGEEDRDGEEEKIKDADFDWVRVVTRNQAELHLDTLLTPGYRFKVKHSDRSRYGNHRLVHAGGYAPLPASQLFPLHSATTIEKQ